MYVQPKCAHIQRMKEKLLSNGKFAYHPNSTHSVLGYKERVEMPKILQVVCILGRCDGVKAFFLPLWH